MTPKISLELRVKEKPLPYPEEVFFDSQGIPVALLGSCLIMQVLALLNISVSGLHDGYIIR